MARPAGYEEDEWEECGECCGTGTWVSDDEPWFDHKCDSCGGEGGWPADATRWDDEELVVNYERGQEL